MSTTHPGVSEEELHAFIDSELGPERSAQLAKLAESDPLLGRRIAAFHSDRQRLVEAYGPVAELPLPEHWLRMIDNRAPPQKHAGTRKRLPPQLIAGIAAGLLLLIGWGFSALYPTAARDEAIISEAMAARGNILHPAQSFAAASLQQPNRRDLVLSSVLAMRIKAPDLTRMGYRLDAIRTFSGVSGRAAVELDYRDGQNTLFTLYLRRPTSPPRVDILDRNGTRICIWQDDVMGAVMAGKMTAGEMARLASLAYSGMFL